MIQGFRTNQVSIVQEPGVLCSIYYLETNLEHNVNPLQKIFAGLQNIAIQGKYEFPYCIFRFLHYVS